MSEALGADLNEREREVLRAVIQEYIASGEPVGSSHLARRAEFDVSSATMRNVMADLEELGYLEKPHTSAGRVPTDRGYRFFCDALIRLKDPAPKDRELIEQGVSVNLDDAMQSASRVLHFLTRHAGVVLTPRPTAIVMERIEFVRLRDDRVLAILIGKNGQVHNKLVSIDFPVTADELVSAGNYLNERLQEQSLAIEELRNRLLLELEAERAKYDALAAKALKLGAAATDVQTPERVLIEGAGSFFESPEFNDVERMKALFRALEEKDHLVTLLDRVQRAREMQIFIGAESEFSSAPDVSVIASPYGTSDSVLGTVGVIGPTRMNYQRIIPLVNFTASVLSRVLNQE